MPPELTNALVFAASAWALLYAPGHALLGRRDSALPIRFSRILASVIVSTLAGTGLAAAELFSLAALLACNAVACVGFFLLRRLSRATRSATDQAPVRDALGPIIFVLALASYWPAYPAFLGASDSSAYVASGISLAHHGTTARQDDLGASLPLPVREVLFDSMSQVFGATGPPFRRTPGAMFLESLDATRAWPCFFPVPSVWAAILVLIGVPGIATAEEAAPVFAPLFASLTLWGFWLVARSWMGRRWGLLAVLLLGASGPFYFAARLPLSEPIAAFFAFGGLAILSAGARPSGAVGPAPTLRTSDALLAGAALGAAVFTRIEIALLLLMAFALLPTLQATRGGPRPAPLPPAFFAALVATASLSIAQAALLPGTYISPLLDHAMNAYVRYLYRFGYPTAGLIAAATAAAAAVVLVLSRFFGLSATLRWGFLLGVLAGHWAASNFLWDRTPMWLSFYVGWPGLALAAAGAVLAWRDRARLPGGPLLLALAASAALILFYNPHVYPALPWGARRFVPLLLPLIVLLACHTAVRAASRSRLLSAACVGALAWFVAAGGHPVWRENLLEGTWSQLETVAAAIPTDGTILIDRQISSMMLGPALWLILDRNNVTVPPTSSSAGREYIPQVVETFAANGPVYFVTRSAADQVRIPHVRMEFLAQAAPAFRLMEQSYNRRPQQIQRYVMPVVIFRLHRDANPLGVLETRRRR
ncbi:MAG: hypothetical protein ABR587_15100 [Candidatus Binatia bacterium]